MCCHGHHKDLIATGSDIVLGVIQVDDVQNPLSVREDETYEARRIHGEAWYGESVACLT
jgi:hypothetical protein